MIQMTFWPSSGRKVCVVSKLTLNWFSQHPLRLLTALGSTVSQRWSLSPKSFLLQDVYDLPSIHGSSSGVQGYHPLALPYEA